MGPRACAENLALTRIDPRTVQPTSSRYTVCDITGIEWGETVKTNPGRERRKEYAQDGRKESNYKK